MSMTVKDSLSESSSERRRVPSDVDPTTLVYIDEVAVMLNRRMTTLRRWEQQGLLPERLLPFRGVKNRRCWTEDQVEGLKVWMREHGRVPGHGLRTLEGRSQEDIDRHLESLRRPRSAA